jgi:hypothetical protein
VQDGFYTTSHSPSVSSRTSPRSSRDATHRAGGPAFVHDTATRAKAWRSSGRGQDYKIELINDKVEGDEVSLYRTGEFLDLCRGPHVRSTKDLKAFKLLRVAGAYWRGDEKQPQLTRIYGTAWQSQRELEEHLKFLEEAEKRDHKKLGKELKLFTVDERVGPGLPLWLPAGATIRRELERFIVDEELARGYLHVRTPDVARLDLFRQSGHAQLYAENMYPPMHFEDGEELELRPVNCPHHIVVFQSELRSYRDLPMRIAEIGNNWRYERSGTLIGLNRVRSFALNDAHIFCTPDQLMDEVKGAIDLALYFSNVLGIDTSLIDCPHATTWDKWLGTEEQWAKRDRPDQALDSMGQPYGSAWGAAFTGRIDFSQDAHRREFAIRPSGRLPFPALRARVAEDGAGTAGHGPPQRCGLDGAAVQLPDRALHRPFPTWLHPVRVVVVRSLMRSTTTPTSSPTACAKQVARWVDDRPERGCGRSAMRRRAGALHDIAGGREAKPVSTCATAPATRPTSHSTNLLNALRWRSPSAAARGRLGFGRRMCPVPRPRS